MLRLGGKIFGGSSHVSLWRAYARPLSAMGSALSDSEASVSRARRKKKLRRDKGFHPKVLIVGHGEMTDVDPVSTRKVTKGVKTQKRSRKEHFVNELKPAGEVDEDGVVFSMGEPTEEEMEDADIFLGALEALPGEETEDMEEEIDMNDTLAVEKALLEAQRRNPIATDLDGQVVLTKIVMTHDGTTYYDMGTGNLASTPKALHERSGNSEKGISASSLRAAADRAAFSSESRGTEGNVIELPLMIEKSELLAFKGELLPNFDDAGSIGAESPVEISWRAVEEAFQSKSVIQCRILNIMNGGFACAVGCLTAFLPNSQLSPFLRGPAAKEWTSRSRKVIGEKLWVHVLNYDRGDRNIVVSHRTVPRHLLSPLISQSGASKYARRLGGPVIVPTAVSLKPSAPASSKRKQR